MKFVEIEELFDSGILDPTYPPSVYYAYCKVMGCDVEELKNWPMLIARRIETNYVGHFATRKDFIYSYILDMCGVVMPTPTVVDHEATWKNLKSDFYFLADDEDGGWYFARH